jgi:hemolysin activation/secretion protein
MPSGTRARPAILLTAGALATLLPLCAAAQTRLDGGALLKTLPDLPQPAVPAKPAPIQTPESATAPEQQAQPGVSVQVKGFRFTGNRRFSHDELAALLTNYSGTRVDFAGLQEAAAKVRNFYRGHGYFLATAYLPKQQIDSGVVTIAVVEGKIGRVKVNAARQSGLSPTLLLNMTQALLPAGSDITEANLERAMLILGELPGTAVRSVMKPGSEEGQADVEVVASARGARANGMLSADNSGACATGRVHENLALSLDNLSGFADSTQVLIGKSNRGGNHYALLNLGVPASFTGGRAGVRYTDLDYQVGGDCAPTLAGLGLHGRARIPALWFSYPLVRTRDESLNLRLETQLKQLSDTDLTQTNDRRVASVSMGLDMDRRDRFNGGGRTQAEVTLTGGSTRLENSNDAFADSLGPKVAGHFNKFNWRLAREQRLNDAFTLAGLTFGQSSNHNLIGAEQYVAGGPNGVRAYPAASGVGDRGLNASVEVRYSSRDMNLNAGRLTLFAFYDYARVQPRVTRGASDPGPYSMSGAGIGLKLVEDQNYALEATLARQVGARPNLGLTGTDASSTRAWLSMMKRF